MRNMTGNVRIMSPRSNARSRGGRIANYKQIVKDAVKSVLRILSAHYKVCYCRLDRWNFI